MTKISLQKRLVDARESTGMSQSEVARHLGLDNSVISRVESGDRRVAATELASFADLYSVSVDYLLGRTQTRNQTEHPPDFISIQEAADLNNFLRGSTVSQLNFKGNQLTRDQGVKLKVALTQIFWDDVKS